MADHFDVETNADYDGIDFERISEEELDKAAVRTQNTWQDLMLEAGYKNTGDTVNSITWEATEQFVRRVGSDRMAALIGEFGRRPGAGFPPPDAISDWVHEQADMPDKGETRELDFGDGKVTITHDDVVFQVSRAIHERGMDAHGFGRRAFNRESKRFEESLEQRLQEAVEQQSTE